MKIRLFVTIISFISQWAYAVHYDSEFLFQTKKGEHSVQLSAEYLNNQKKAEITLVETLTGLNDANMSFFEKELAKDMNIQLTYEAGLFDGFSGYISTGYGSGKGKVENEETSWQTKHKGLNPIDLGVKYSMEAGYGRVYLQGNWHIGFFDRHKQKEDFNYQTNRVFGNSAFDIGLGYMMNLNTSNLFGALFRTGVYSSDAKATVSYKNETHDIEYERDLKPGWAFSFFYETMISKKSLLGGSLSFSKRTRGKPLHMNNNFPLYSSLFKWEHSMIREQISSVHAYMYARLPLLDQLNLITSLGYNKLLNSKKLKAGKGGYRHYRSVKSIENLFSTLR